MTAEPRYLRGIDHFNQGEFFEAHEVWEDLWIELNDERRRVRITLSEGQPPYAVGEYTVGAGSFFVGDYNALQLGRLELVPMRAVEGGAKLHETVKKASGGTF